MKHFFYVVFLVLFFITMTGCATTNGKEKVYTGMSKSELIKELGLPMGVTKNGNVEYLSYKDPKKPALVKIVEGKVVSIISPDADSYVTTNLKSKSYY